LLLLRVTVRFLGLGLTLLKLALGLVFGLWLGYSVGVTVRILSPGIG